MKKRPTFEEWNQLESMLGIRWNLIVEALAEEARKKDAKRPRSKKPKSDRNKQS